ncbi:MAG: cytochrome C oxidase subunit IV family protein [Pirellulales bacterium]|jgi:cytochrome c oxidase subunit 4|nr:cytochrome C oxidase subunit IV family protein [Pirellulales bacterium]
MSNSDAPNGSSSSADAGSSEHGPRTTPGGLPETAAPAAAVVEASHDESHGGLRVYVAVFVALCVLTTMSFFTYSPLWPWRDEPQVGWAFMMAVSCTKAMLVVLFFMHVLWEANWKYVLTIPAAMMAIFLAIMLVPDIGYRSRMVSQERLLYMARPSDEALMHQAGTAAEAKAGAEEAH